MFKKDFKEKKYVAMHLVKFDIMVKQLRVQGNTCSTKILNVPEKNALEAPVSKPTGWGHLTY